MRVDISQTQIKIFEAIKQISNKRKSNKKISINAFSISKVTKLDWRTVNKYLQKGII